MAVTENSFKAFARTQIFRANCSNVLAATFADIPLRMVSSRWPVRPTQATTGTDPVSGSPHEPAK